MGTLEMNTPSCFRIVIGTIKKCIVIAIIIYNYYNCIQLLDKLLDLVHDDVPRRSFIKNVF